MTKAKGDFADIDWPRRPLHGDAMRLKYATALTELMTEQKITAVALAEKVFGRDPDTNSVKSADTIRQYCNGEKFPSPDTATKLAKVLKVALSRLITPKGKLIAPTERSVRPGAQASAPPPLELPKGAPPITCKLEDLKADPRFATVTISGTVEFDVALAILALVHRKQ